MTPPESSQGTTPQSAEQPTGSGSGGKSRRFPVLDVLRGVAVLGILLMNVQSFGRISSEYHNPKALQDPPPVDWTVWLINHVIADEKFIALLTVLFGAGIILMARGSKQSSAEFERLFTRRMAWLFLFGLLHGLLVWPGDILAAYAVCGLIALRFRHKPTRELMLWGLALFAAVMVLWMLFSAVLIFALPGDLLRALEARYWTPDPETVGQELNRILFDWVYTAGERAWNAVGAQLWMLASDRIWRMTAMMLFGMALMKSGFLTGQWSPRSYRRALGIGLATGMPLVLAGVWFNEVVGWDMRYSMFLGRIANHWGSLGVSLAWIALVVLLVQRDFFRYAAHALEAVGRLAMTNYLGQSLICAGIFYGVGLGLFLRFGYLELMGIVAAIWAFQIAFSLVWRRYFRLGPFEGLWRYLARG